MHIILKSDLKMAQTSARSHIYFWKMNAHMTMLVIIVKFSTSLVIQIACAGGPDL